MQSNNWSKIADYFIDPASAINVTGTTTKSILVAQGLLALLLTVNIGWNYINTFIKEGQKGKLFDLSEMKRAIWYAILVGFFPTFLIVVWNLGDYVAGLFEIDVNGKAAKLEQFNQAVLSTAGSDSINIFNLSMDLLLDSLGTGVMFLSLLFMYIVRFVIMLFVGVFAKFLIVVSPFAAAFSIIPVFKDGAIKLLGIFTNAAFVALTLNILDNILFNSILANIVNTMVTESGSEAVGGIFFNKIIITTVCFTMIILTLLAVWLTSKYVGSPGSAFVLGMATTVTTIATAAAIKGVTSVLSAGLSGAGAAAGAAGGGDNRVGSIIKGTASGIREDKNE